MQITVYAHPNSKMPRILERSPGIFDIYVAEVSKDGKANKAIIKAIAGYLDIAPSRVTIKRGHTGKIKVLAVD